jgi:hypothetical protein
MFYTIQRDFLLPGVRRLIDKPEVQPMLFWAKTEKPGKNCEKTV